MSFFVPSRRPSLEALDDVRLSSEEMFRSLQDLAFVDRHWGGSRALERFLLQRMRAAGHSSVRLLDVGAGSGSVSRRLAWALRREGFEATVVAVDLQWRHLAAGARMSPNHPLAAAAADVFSLPFAARSFDWIISTLLFHHFSPEQNGRLLRELARVARRGFALLDVRRHLFPLIFICAVGRVVFKSQASTKDGPASVRQAYTPEEARSIASAAIPGTRVDRAFPFQLLISCDWA